MGETGLIEPAVSNRSAVGVADDRPVPSNADLLRLLGSGATVAILCALGDGPLRTNAMTRRVAGYTPRSIYRYMGALIGLGVIERREYPGVPSNVVHSLTAPRGRDLWTLVERFTDASLSSTGVTGIDSRTWSSWIILADLWSCGMIDDLAREARSPTELAQEGRELTYHQVNRRAEMLALAGFLADSPGPGPGRRRRYAMTDECRRTMGLLTGIGQWRERHLLEGEQEGMTKREIATVLRAGLNMVNSNGRSLAFDVLELEGDELQVLVTVGADVGIATDDGQVSRITGSARGEIRSWMNLVTLGASRCVTLEGDEEMAEECLAALHGALWKLNQTKIRED